MVGTHTFMHPRYSFTGTAGWLCRRGTSVTLTSLLAKLPQQFDERKISVVERNLGRIDLLPGRYRGIEKLYCSKNRLRSLEGIQQFGSMRGLSVADNFLSSFSDLDAVVDLAETLESASFEGNPVCRLPNYRAHVLRKLPSLKTLDGRPVEERERQSALLALRREDTMLALMISNANLINKIVAPPSSAPPPPRGRRPPFTASQQRRSFLDQLQIIISDMQPHLSSLLCRHSLSGPAHVSPM
eukprot:jgi/Botrbrau1/14324/Bobra.0287s0016.1